VFRKFLDVSPLTWGTLTALALVGIGLYTLARRGRGGWSARVLAMGALSVALSFLLSYIRLYRMPQGGSITPASMLPLLAFAFYFGPGAGVLAGAAAGLLQLLQDMYILNFTQALLDYPIAFGILAVAGLFRKAPEAWGFYAGIFAGILGRFLCSTLSGAVFFAEYAGAMNPWLYSAGYNGTYLAVEAALCLVVAAVPAVRGAFRRIAAAGS
jgi:thiamine transporter